jgi:hypothetical protein
MNLKNNDMMFETKLLYEISSSRDLVSCVAASHLIQGECAILLNKTGDVYLLNEETVNTINIDDQNAKSLRIASGIEPTYGSFDENKNWKSIRFGAQPRQFIYSDFTQLISIDSRIKTTNKSNFRELFSFNKINNSWNNSEIIHRTQIADNDYFCHLICGSKTLTLVDERFTKHPLLQWKHHLNSPAVFLKNFYLPSLTNNLSENSMSRSNYSHFVVYSDANEVFLQQFSTKHGM